MSFSVSLIWHTLGKNTCSRLTIKTLVEIFMDAAVVSLLLTLNRYFPSCDQGVKMFVSGGKKCSFFGKFCVRTN